MKNDIFFMKRCLILASHGLGQTAPNPMVGCVITHKGVIIGEGYHTKCGAPHAEVNAIENVKDKTLLPHATMYVSLEPCAHYGKTPPCADLIIKQKIPKVVIACTDSHSKVAGKGIAKLKEHGCHVSVGVMEQEARFLNRRFFTFHDKKRPYIILKWAETADGFIDVNRKKNDPQAPTWISGEESRCLVHKWRTEEDAIMVGRVTALTDNPTLNARDWQGKNPIRLIIDKNITLPPNLNVFNADSHTVVFNALKNAKKDNIRYVKISFEEDLPITIARYLYEQNVQSVIVEGGSRLINSFVQSKLWDEARVFKGRINFSSGVKAPAVPVLSSDTITMGNDVLNIFYR